MGHGICSAKAPIEPPECKAYEYGLTMWPIGFHLCDCSAPPTFSPERQDGAGKPIGGMLMMWPLYLSLKLMRKHFTVTW